MSIIMEWIQYQTTETFLTRMLISKSIQQSTINWHTAACSRLLCPQLVNSECTDSVTVIGIKANLCLCNSPSILQLLCQNWAFPKLRQFCKYNPFLLWCFKVNVAKRIVKCPPLASRYMRSVVQTCATAAVTTVILILTCNGFLVWNRCYT